jgi:hypothetical protein
VVTFKKGGERKNRDGVMEAICQAISILPGYAKNLLKDADFGQLREDAEAKKRLPALKG